MNIIQVQNRLKGVTDEALVQYINNPTGDVPTYLALGEVGRREDMRKEYQASQAEQPQKTVAEEMVAKLSTPTGIGALTNNMGPRMAPEEVMSSSESISETGIAPLPIDMPQNFERGGIVGYANGGVTGGIDFSQTNIDDSIYNPNTGTMFSDDVQVDTIGINPNPVFPFGQEVSEVYGMLEEPQVADYKEDLEERKAAFGIDNTYYDDERTAIQEEKDLIAKRREGLMPDAMIRAGLGIASGQDQNAFTNVAQGLAPAFEQYVKDDDTLIKEEKLSRKEDRLLNKMKRAEDIGDMKGFEAYGKEVRATQLKLIELEIDSATKRLTARATGNKNMIEALKIATQRLKDKYLDPATAFAETPELLEKELKEQTQYALDAINSGILPKDVPISLGFQNADETGSGTYKKMTKEERAEAIKNKRKALSPEYQKIKDQYST